MHCYDANCALIVDMFDVTVYIKQRQSLHRMKVMLLLIFAIPCPIAYGMWYMKSEGQ